MRGNFFPNHAFAIGADAEWADRNPGANNTISLKTPGVPARLVAAGKTWANYGRGFAFPHFQDPLMRATPRTTFAQDAKGGSLPNVSWVYGPGGQDFHPEPRTKMSASDAWLGQAFASLASGPDWPHVVAFSNGRLHRPHPEPVSTTALRSHASAGVKIFFSRRVVGRQK